MNTAGYPSATDVESHDPFLTSSATGQASPLVRYLTGGMLWMVAGFLAITTFEGVLRYAAAKAGVPWIIYAKDLLIIGAVVLGVICTFASDLRNLAFWTVGLIAAIGVTVGFVLLPDPKQSLFAAKTWLPLICGTLVGAMAGGDSRILRRTCQILWISAVVGIVLTVFWPAPWVGFVYEVGGVEMEGSREWAIGEAVRSAGFSRASFDAAMQCLFFGTIIAMSSRFGVAILIWLVSAGAIFLSVSRTALIAVVVAGALYLLVRSLSATQRLAKLAVLGLAISVIALPFASAYYYKEVAGIADTTTVASTSSFEMRALETWPEGMALLERGGNVVTGRGLGGIGVAQEFFEREIFSPGDNLFVYLWVALGSLGIALLLFIPFQVWRAAMPLTTKRQAAVVMVGAFLAIGLTLNGIEAAIASLFLGLSLAWLSDTAQED